METMESEFMRVKKLSVAIGLIAASVTYSASAETFNVFEPSASGVPAAGTTSGGTVVGSATYNTDINGSINEDSSLTLNLDVLDGNAEFDVVSVNKDGSGVSYSATSASMDILNVAVSDGVMMGSLSYGGKVYKFNPSGNGDTLIVETTEVTESTPPAMSSGSEGGESLEGGSDDVAAGGTDDGSVINVIVAYTQEFVDEVGGAGNVAAYMATMEQETNLSFSLSGVNTAVDIVHNYQTSYSDSTNYRKDADFFMNGLGAGQQLRAMRDDNLADIMIVMTGNMGYDSCGYSAGFNVQGDGENPNGHNALALVREGCGTGYYGMAHQLGFIFGADLNQGNPNMNGGGVAHAHGYCGGGFRTIMAYNCTGSTGGKRLPFWSNPNKDFNGSPTGDAGANNVQVLNDRALEVANFRFPVAAPGTPTLSSPAGQTINPTPPPVFSWTRANPDHASSYTLSITDSEGTVHEHTVTPSQANCAGADTTCAFTLPADPALPLGIANWTVTAKNASGESTSDNGITSVSLAPVVPGDVDAATMLPNSIISDPKPAYSWEAGSPVASHYRLYVNDGAIYKWYTNIQLGCEAPGDTCIVPDADSLAAMPTGVTVPWTVQGWSNAGYAENRSNADFSILPQ